MNLRVNTNGCTVCGIIAALLEVDGVLLCKVSGVFSSCTDYQ